MAYVTMFTKSSVQWSEMLQKRCEKGNLTIGVKYSLFDILKNLNATIYCVCNGKSFECELSEAVQNFHRDGKKLSPKEETCAIVKIDNLFCLSFISSPDLKTEIDILRYVPFNKGEFLKDHYRDIGHHVISMEIAAELGFGIYRDALCYTYNSHMYYVSSYSFGKCDLNLDLNKAGNIIINDIRYSIPKVENVVTADIQNTATTSFSNKVSTSIIQLAANAAIDIKDRPLGGALGGVITGTQEEPTVLQYGGIVPIMVAYYFDGLFYPDELFYPLNKRIVVADECVSHLGAFDNGFPLLIKSSDPCMLVFTAAPNLNPRGAKDEDKGRFTDDTLSQFYGSIHAMFSALKGRDFNSAVFNAIGCGIYRCPSNLCAYIFYICAIKFGVKNLNFAILERHPYEAIEQFKKIFKV